MKTEYLRITHQQTAWPETVRLNLDQTQTTEAMNQALEQLLEAQERTVIEQSERLERETQALYRRIFDHSNDAIIVCDPTEDLILDANPSASVMLGYPQDELIGLKLSAVHPLDTPELRNFVDSVFLQGSASTSELSCVTRGGERIPAEISASSIYIGGLPCILAMVRDIRERKSAEESARDMAVLDERNRLARELHDSVTQSLYSLILFAESGRRGAASGDLQTAGTHLSNVGGIAQQALKEMRLLVHQLRPMDFGPGGLVRAIQRRLESVERRAGVQARLDARGSGEIDPETEYEVFTVIQEALNNSLKHSYAKNVLVNVQFMEDRFEFSVSDNGVGFDVGGDVGAGGMGLFNMRDRLARLQGRIEVDSASTTGTVVSGVVPALSERKSST